MTENRNYLQKYAMHFGTYMGVYWIVKFILLPLGFTIPFLFFLFTGLTLGVPFMGYYYAKIYRDKACKGVINFSQACLFTLFMYMFASLLVAMAHFIYFHFIDHGFILNEYSRMVNEAMQTTPGLGLQKELIYNAIGELRGMTAIDVTLQLLSSNIFFGSLLAIPTALFVMKRNKSKSSTTVDSTKL